jgi:hypothetical protein
MPRGHVAGAERFGVTLLVGPGIGSSTSNGLTVAAEVASDLRTGMEYISSDMQ